jgi:hypothetical protein
MFFWVRRKQYLKKPDSQFANPLAIITLMITPPTSQFIASWSNGNSHENDW